MLTLSSTALLCTRNKIKALLLHGLARKQEIGPVFCFHTLRSFAFLGPRVCRQAGWTSGLLLFLQHLTSMFVFLARESHLLLYNFERDGKPHYPRISFMGKLVHPQARSSSDRSSFYVPACAVQTAFATMLRSVTTSRTLTLFV